jgi:hypothetical protein
MVGHQLLHFSFQRRARLSLNLMCVYVSFCKMCTRLKSISRWPFANNDVTAAYVSCIPKSRARRALQKDVSGEDLCRLRSCRFNENVRLQRATTLLSAPFAERIVIYNIDADKKRPCRSCRSRVVKIRVKLCS